jgi:hypothetical protein
MEIVPTAYRTNPGVLPMLRMATVAPLERDRLIALSSVSENGVESMEGDRKAGPAPPPRPVVARGH